MVAITGIGYWPGERLAGLHDIQAREKHTMAAALHPALAQGPLAQAGGTQPSWLRLGPQTMVSHQQAHEAFGRLFHNADIGREVPPGNDRRSVMPPAREFQKMSVELMMVAVTLTAGELIGHITDAKAKAVKILGDQQDNLRSQELKDFREQIEKALEDQNKAKKAGIFGVIFDWVVAAVEVVTGVAKIVGGVLTGNAMTAAAGAMDLMAGLSGVVKAAMNTMALIDPANADMWRKIGSEAAKVQLFFEIAGAVIDISSALRNALLTKVIPQATKECLKAGAAQVISEAIERGVKTVAAEAVERTVKEGVDQMVGAATQAAAQAAAKASAKAAVAEVADQVGKQVADQVAEKLMRKLGKKALDSSADAASKVVQQLGVNKMLSKFSHEAIEKLVTESIKKAANHAIDEGIALSAEQLTKKIVKDIAQQVATTALKASTYIATAATREAVGGAQKITAGALAMQRAQLQKEIDSLVLDQQWLMMLVEMFEREKKQQVEEMKRLTEGQIDASAGASDMLREAAQTRMRGATSMAGVAAHVA